MQCYTELIPPTAVTHAVSLPFLDPTATNLVTAKTSLLQVYSLRTVTETGQLKAPNLNGKADNNTLGGEDAFQKTETSSKLVLIGEYPLSGTVTSLARVKASHTKTGAEALLVAFKNAKLSLVEWDPENFRISTVSIHYYEGEKIQKAPFGPDLKDCASILTVDPRSRCAALKFGANHLAILPFRQPGDELVEADYDPDLDTPPPTKPSEEEAATKSDGLARPTPYGSSFVLPLTALDSALTKPVDLAFLHEYREPTFGVISSNKAAGPALLDERKDVLSYTVFTLDLDQRASTTLLSVTGLPFDLFRIIPLPLPVGGALLIGANELVHVDQAGKSNAVAVNEFARQCTDFSLADQSSLSLKLEGCMIAPLDLNSGDMLIALQTGELAILSFRIDGRSVSGLSVHIVEGSKGGNTLQSGPSSTASLGRGRFFVGSEDGDSTLFGWSEKIIQSSRKRSHAQMIAEEAELSLDEDYEDENADDDLYGGETSTIKQSATKTANKVTLPGNLIFRVHDTLPSLGPMGKVVLGKPVSSASDNKRRKTDTGTEGTNPTLSLLAAVGRGSSSALASLNQDIVPNVIELTVSPSVQAVWAMCIKRTAPKGLPAAEDGQQDPEEQLSADGQHDQYMVKFTVDDDGKEESKIYHIDQHTKADGSDHEPFSNEVTDTEFENEGETLNMGTLAAGTRIVQVGRSEIRSYDADLGLAQIFPILDPATEEELQVLHSAFANDYLLLLRSDSSVQILQVDASGDLEEVEAGEEFASAKWTSGCIYQSEHTNNRALAFLLSATGGLEIFELPNLQEAVYSASALSALPPILSTEDRQRRAAARETLMEVLFADLGRASHKSPYLIVRSSTDDLILYEPFHYPLSDSGPSASFTANLRFRKVPLVHIPKYDEEAASFRATPLCALDNVGGYAAVSMAGGSPSFILKEPSSLPRVVKLKGKAVRSLNSLNTKQCEAGFVYVDSSGITRQCQLPPDTTYGHTGWATRKLLPLPIGHVIREISYHAERDLYIISSSEPVDFCPPEDQHGSEEDIGLRPKTSQYYLHLFEPKSGTIIDTFFLPPHELVTSLACASLEVSENTHKQKLLVAAGTITQRGEAFAARGGIYVLDIIDVVPEPGFPHTGSKLQIISREETKGGITALTGIAGLLGTGQGQKIMFRGLKEDGQCLPVAFLDAQCYLTSLKSMGSSKLWLAADAWKGLWFGGFSEEPYKISLFGKSRSKMEVITADFLPFEKQLFLVVVDADKDMHVLQYDPENPKSLSGQRLLHRSTFHLGHFPTSMTLLPSTLSPFSEQPVTNGYADGETPTPTSSSAPTLHHVLVTTQSGSVALVTPLDESTYRRLSALQTHLTSVLEHPAGLNPRAYRAVESEGLGARGVVDGDMVCRIGELGAGRRAEVLGRAGADTWGLRSDMEIIGGGGLGYL